MNIVTLQSAISKASRFLAAEQQKSGNFLSYTTKEKDNFANAQPLNSIFLTALILSSISRESKLHDVREKAAKFLLRQKSINSSWNYWVRESAESKKNPYPDDLDDTFCALSAIFLYDKKIVDGGMLVDAIKILTAMEQREGGPYYTWLVGNEASDEWRDIDLAVNSNIAYFLSLNNVFLPNLQNFVEGAIIKKKLRSPYYFSEFPVIYFISRFYNGKNSGELIEYILSKQKVNGGWGHALTTAIAISSLINLGYEGAKLKQGIELLTRLCEKKNFCSYPFVIEKVEKNAVSYSGSPALTCAFIIEALTNVKQFLEKHNPKLMQINKDGLSICDKIIDKFKASFSDSEESLKLMADKKLIQMSGSIKKNLITLLPFYFNQSLDKKYEKKISEKCIVDLGLANLYGWIAYTIYDNILDKEGDNEYVSLANFCLQQLTEIYANISAKEPAIASTFKETLKRIDNANAWESQNCHFEIKNGAFSIPQKLPNYLDYGILAEKSMGHALGPISTLLLLGFNKRTLEYKNTVSFFRNFIIAKQIDDDAHDWKDDLKFGRVNSVGQLVLKEAQKTKVKQFDLNNLTKLEEIFWYKISDQVSQTILTHVKSAEKAVTRVKIIRDYDLFLNLLKPHRESAERSISERKKALEFLKKY